MHNSDPKPFIEKAIKTFSIINDKIKLLIDCSAEDFDILNQGFQSYYTKTKELTDNTDSLFQHNLKVSEGLSKSDITSLNKIEPVLNINFSNAIDTSRELTLVIKDLSYIYLNINNLKQNINTLKLITTNMRFEPKYNKTYDELIDFINNLLECSQHFDQELKKTEVKLTKCTDTLNKICTLQFQSFIDTFQKHITVLSKFNISKLRWEEHRNTIGELITKNTSSTADIITNLQFQDIIRQKIEHVQEAQDNLLNKLKQFEKNSKSEIETNNTQLLHVLFQIRNIGSLQAAQLVHANNEYQKAIDTITARFEELDYVLIETLKILQGISQKPIKNSKFPLQNLLESNNSLASNYAELNKLNSELEHLYTEIFREDTILSQSNKNLSCAIDNCKKLIQKIQTHKLNVTLKKDIDPIHQLLENFESFLSNSDETRSAIGENQENIKKSVLPGLEHYFSSSLKIDKVLKTHFENLQNVLNDEITKSAAIEINPAHFNIDNIKFNTDQLKYYQIFDKEIEDIIAKINDLCGEIDFEKLEQNINDKEINEIAKLYTMDSEREIHSLITGDDFESTQNDDIELF